MTPRKPIRVRKARRAGTCPLSECRRRIQVGDLIASIGGAPFICVAHITRKHTDSEEIRPWSATVDSSFTPPTP